MLLSELTKKTLEQQTNASLSLLSGLNTPQVELPVAIEMPADLKIAFGQRSGQVSQPNRDHIPLSMAHQQQETFDEELLMSNYDQGLQPKNNPSSTNIDCY